MHEDLADLLAAFALHVLSETIQNGTAITAQNVHTALGNAIGTYALATPDEIDNAMEELAAKGWVTAHRFKYASTRYEITKVGIAVTRDSQVKFETLSNFYKFGRAWLVEALQNVRRADIFFEPHPLAPVESKRTSGDATVNDAGDDHGIPASNRYVSAKDNQPKIDEMRESVSTLIEAIREDRTNDFDDKEGRLGELLAFDLLLQQPQISVPAVELILRDTVFYLAKTFAKSAIGIIAGKLLVSAAPFFGIHL